MESYIRRAIVHENPDVLKGQELFFKAKVWTKNKM